MLTEKKYIIGQKSASKEDDSTYDEWETDDVDKLVSHFDLCRIAKEV